MTLKSVGDNLKLQQQLAGRFAYRRQLGAEANLLDALFIVPFGLPPL
jgi:hypothetical protein